MSLWPLVPFKPRKKVRHALLQVDMHDIFDLLLPPDQMTPLSVHYDQSTRQLWFLVHHPDLPEVEDGHMLPQLWVGYTEITEAQSRRVTAEWEAPGGVVLT